MAESISNIKIFLGTPGDVLEERKIVEKVINEINQHFIESFKININLLTWENYARPGIGEDAQDVINKQIPSDYDIFVGIMWARFGTPTKRADSGTEEEFERAYKLFQEGNKDLKIMFYFKDEPISPSKIDYQQLGKVSKFKHKIQKKGIFQWSYKSQDEFQEIFRKHLMQEIVDWIKNINKNIHSKKGQKSNFKKSIDKKKLIGFAKTGKIEDILNIIQSSTDFNTSDKGGNTLLMIALTKKNVKLSKILIEKGADLNIQNENDQSALHLAIDNDLFEIALQIISLGASINIIYKDIAIPISPGTSTINRGISPLHQAVEKNEVNIINALIKNGADIDIKSYSDGIRPIHYAANDKRIESLNILIENGAEINIKQDSTFSTPLHWAVSGSHFIATKRLIEAGANVNTSNHMGETPLHEAEKRKIGELLIEANADITKECWAFQYRGQPIHSAATRGSVEIVKLLLENKIDVNVRDDEGATPLHHCADDGSYETAEILIKYGADLEVRTSPYSDELPNITPLHQATISHNYEVVKVLIENGANVNSEVDGETPLDFTEHSIFMGEMPYELYERKMKTQQILIENGGKAYVQEIGAIKKSDIRIIPVDKLPEKYKK